MSSQTPVSTAPAYLTLNGAQKHLRDAYFDHDSGLFIMNAVPGAGKSVTVADIAAREVLQRFDAGEPAPEQTVTVLSFNAEQADELGPKIANRLETLVEHDATSAAASMDEEQLAELSRQIRQSDNIGTVDSLLREVFSDIVGAVGFGELPAIGDDLHLGQLHTSIYADLASSDAVTEELQLLMDAYPPDDYEDAPATLLRRGVRICRQQRLSTDEFHDRLLDTVEAVYPEGPPDEPANLMDTLHRVLDTDAATDLGDSLADGDIEAVVEADIDLYDGWREAIEAYTMVLDEYRRRYRKAIRAESILSHTDVANLVANFLDGSRPGADEHTALRERVLGRYRHRLQSLIIDEAQDIATIQHDVLASLVGEDTRVFLAGDLRQSIYVWRDARPSLFAQAIDDGQYLGRDWDTHVTETTQTTYRARPGIAGAIDAICEPALTDDDRGNLTDFEVEYPRLTPDRDPIEGANVHIAGFDPTGPPGTPWYVEDGGSGEAPALAEAIATSLSNGDFAVEGDDPSVMILFRWRTHMDSYREAFEDAGLSVATAASYLFTADSTNIVLDVLNWLPDPTDSNALQTLVRESALGIETLEPAFAAADWSLAGLVADTSNSTDLDDTERALLEQLSDLQRQSLTLRNQPVPETIRTIIDTLALRADRYDLTETDPEQRVANCDALTDYVEDSTSDVEVTLEVFQRRLARVRDAPYRGPTQPVPETDADVLFTTIHQAKGDEADVVALADPGFPLHKHGPVGERLITSPDVFALAPPASAAGAVPTDAGDAVALTPHYGGLYTPDSDQDPNTPGIFTVEGGIRWASERWRASGLSGHDHLQRAVAETRAESWRLLYVALTRARNHLVLPLPWSVPGQLQPRDRWLDTLIEGVNFEVIDSSLQYDLAAPHPRDPSNARSVTVEVRDADAIQVNTTQLDTDDRSPPTAARHPVEAETLPALIPRFIRPSTLKPLADDRDQHLLAHLQNQPLHTETDGLDPDLPLAIDAMDPDAIGKFTHGVLSRAIAAGLDGQNLHTQNPIFDAIVETALDTHGPPANQAEREGLVTYLTEHVIPDILDSQLWTDIQQANAVYTEVPLRGEYALDDHTVEVEGQADLVLQLPDDSWQVVDLKIALTAPNAATKERYRLQTSMYGDLLERTLDGDVLSAVETVGATAERSTAPWPRIDIDSWLQTVSSTAFSHAAAHNRG